MKGVFLFLYFFFPEKTPVEVSMKLFQATKESTTQETPKNVSWLVFYFQNLS